MSKFSLGFQLLKSQRGGGYSLRQLKHLYNQTGGVKKTQEPIVKKTTSVKTTTTSPPSSPPSSRVLDQTKQVGDLKVRFVFVPEKTNTSNDQVAAQLEDSLQRGRIGLDPESKKSLFEDITTGKNKFKALALVEGPDGKTYEMAGFASGKYNTGLMDFSKITTEGFIRSSEIKWIEILRSFRGKKLCQAFMEFLLSTLSSLGVDNVKVENVGGLAACICYLKAAKKFQARGFFAIDPQSNDPWYPIEIEDCAGKHEELNYIFFPGDVTLNMNYKSD